MGHTSCTEPQCLYSRAIPLLPLWTVRSVQSLSACTVQLYLYSPYWPYCMYRASVLYSSAIPVLTLWTVRHVQSLSACTVQLYLYSPYGPYGLYRASVPVQYSYTSTPPIGRAAYTEPQFLYKGAIIYEPLTFHLNTGTDSSKRSRKCRRLRHYLSKPEILTTQGTVMCITSSLHCCGVLYFLSSRMCMQTGAFSVSRLSEK